MADASTGPDPEKDADHAAAEWLFQDDAEPSKGPQPVITPGGEGFDLVDAPDPAPVPAQRPHSPPPSSEWELAAEDAYSAKAAERTKPTLSPPRERERPAAGARRLDAGPAVDPVWSRGSEWGATIVFLLVWSAAVWFVIYLCVASELYFPALVTFAIGAVVGLALMYPIIITLERPVRMTPEQALRDYYNALSHHFPHYKRMWLLLSNAGRTTSQFASYEGFKRHWKGKLTQLREGRVKGSAPLVFVVSEFKSEKSGGKSVIDASWTIQVFVRGKREAGPIWSLPMASSLVKGPDGMWYLDDGTLAERTAKKAARTEA